MAGKKIFNTQDLVLKVNDKNFDPIKFPLDEWERFLDVLCQNREYQKEAIKTAVMLAKPGDVICVAGKGHEKYQEIKGVKYPFDDKQILSETFKTLSR